MQTFYKICLILMIVGGINWGLVGLFQFDFVGWLLGGSASIWSRIVFTLVGLAALCGIPGLFTEETEEEQNGCCTIACSSRFIAYRCANLLKNSLDKHFSLCYITGSKQGIRLCKALEQKEYAE